MKASPRLHLALGIDAVSCLSPAPVDAPLKHDRMCAGGLKLWESAVDLARFLLERSSPPVSAGAPCTGSMAGMRVIELGCGHGLPGIVCALAGAEVCFQVGMLFQVPLSL